MEDQSKEVLDFVVSKTVEAAKNMDDVIKKHVVYKVPAEPGWSYGMSNLTATEITVHKVTTWAILGPIEFPIPMANWNMSMLPIDDETGKPVSIGGFQGIFGPEYDNDDQIIKEMKKNMKGE
jgi:hypothetical protein